MHLENSKLSFHKTNKIIEFNPDLINYKEKIKLECEKKEGKDKYLKFGITIEGFTKIITF